MAQTLRFASLGSVMPLSVAATMSQCSKAEANWLRLSGLWRSQWKQFGKSPLVGIDAAAPLDGFEVFFVGESGDLLGFGFAR